MLDLKKSVREVVFVKYPESCNINKFIDDRLAGLEYACISHDKDIDENGVAKKSHMHFIVKFPTPRKVSTILSRFDIDYCEQVSNSLAYLKYMTHSDYESIEKGKYRYNDCELFCTSYYQKILFENQQTTIVDVLEIARNNNIFSFREFFLFINSEYPFLVNECITRAYFISIYLKS